MQTLFSPFRIRELELRNRIVMPSLASFLIEEGGHIPERAIEHYRRRASGGVAMVIMEACSVAPEGVVSAHQARIDHDGLIEGLSKIARAIKEEGAVPAIQIHHGGRQTSARVIGRKPLAPSPLPCPTIRGDVEPLTIEAIQDLVQRFGRAAERAVEAGFELIELHGAHGYLINQFLSPFSNIREDAYGGDIVRRARFAKEIILELRRRIGPDFPLSFKISAQEFVQGGLDVPESIEILKILVPAGLDVVQVSAGNDATPEWICQPMFMEQACLSEAARRIREAIQVPIMTVGRINDPHLAEDLIDKGVADLVCIGRGLIADPELPRKAMEGRLDEIRRCIACNTCMQSIFRRGRVECLVNPTLGREKEMVIRPAEVRRKILVIGGGPGGLNLAWVAAQRGHEVHLYEKAPVLGGQLLLGSVTGYKRELLSLIRFQESQIKRFGVICHLGEEATLETIRHEQPDAVVLAAGSRPIRPEVEGIDHPMVIFPAEALNGARPLGEEIVIVGGGPTGCEIALHLAENDCRVTIVEKLADLGAGLETMTRKILLRRLKARAVKAYTKHSLVRIGGTGVDIQGETGEPFTVPAERVVVAIGNQPDDRLFNEIVEAGYEVHQIGDCREPSSAKNAIYEGAVLGRRL